MKQVCCRFNVDLASASLNTSKSQDDESVMKILSHRGFWRERGERNSPRAFARSLNYQFGLETDIRDRGGELVISHDVPVGGEMGFEEILDMFHGKGLPLALNIKSDGLAPLVKSAMSAYSIEDWFVFDMSIPDMRSYLNEKLPVFARVSEVEKSPPWIEEVVGIWFDSFSADSYDSDEISKYLLDGKRVCIVSPELHNRPYLAAWGDIKTLSDQAGLMICTDHPEQARQFFSRNG